MISQNEIDILNNATLVNVRQPDGELKPIAQDEVKTYIDNGWRWHSISHLGNGRYSVLLEHGD